MNLRPLITEIRTLLGGMVKDTLAALIPKNQYTEALNMKLTEPTANTLGGMTVSVGNVPAFSLGQIFFENDEDDYKGFRVRFDVSANSIDHNFEIFDSAGSSLLSFTLSVTGANNAARYAALVSALEAATTTIAGDVYIPGESSAITAGSAWVGFRAYGDDYSITEEVEPFPAEPEVIHVLKEFYGTTLNGLFYPLKTIPIGDDLYVLSSTGGVFRWGVGKKNPITSVWTYTVLLETKQIVIDVDSVIDLDGEVDFTTRISLYFTGSGVLPRCLYVTHQDTWEDEYAFIYTEDPDYIQNGNPSGFYTHENVVESTQLQVLQNFAFVTGVSDVNNTGGSLTSGGYYYCIRQLVGNATSSGFSQMSNVMSVFEDSLANVNLSGSNGGLPTSKSVTLSIQGLNPDVYDQFEIAVLYNTNGVFTASLIGPYDITSTNATITHTGYEASSELAFSELVTQQVLIRDSKSLRINRNRLFLANVRVRVDEDLTPYTSAFTVTTERATLPACGTVSPGAVAEYMKPNNVFQYLGYMLNEIYRFAIIFFYKTGFISSPYFIADFQITHATGELTDQPTGTPTFIYVYHPGIDVDLAGFPDVDGVPFEDAIYGFSIVRLPCIPEVQETGYLMPQTATSGSTFTVGQAVAENYTYGAGGAAVERRRCGFMSPDITMGLVNPVFTQGHKFLLYGQPYNYNTVLQSTIASTPTYSFLREYNGGFNAAYIELSIEDTQLVPFNDAGTKVFSGLTYTTEVTQPNNKGGNNQKSVGVLLDSSSYAVPVTGNTDHAFGYAQHYTPAPGKYGDQNTGNYISCGHFKVVDGSGTYSEDVFGGDTFTQKNYFKLMNKDTISFVLSGALAPTGLGAFGAGAYIYQLAGLLPDGSTVIYGAPYNVTRTIPDLTNSVVLAWDTTLGTLWNIYRTNPGGLTYLIYTGTGTSYIDNGAGALAVPPVSTVVDAQIKTGLSFYSQNRNNIQLRYFTGLETNLNYPYQTTSETAWLADVEDEGTLLYSDSYTPTNTIQTMLAYNPDLPVSEYYGNIIYYSNPKISNTPNDPYRVYGPLNFKAFGALFGNINNIFRYKNFLRILMDNAGILQDLDQQVAISPASGGSIQIGDGSVMSSREEIVTNYGNQIKTAATTYINRNVTYDVWYDHSHKKIMRWGIDGVKDLTEDNLMQSFFNENGQFLGAEKSMSMGYDDMSKEVLISTAATLPDANPYIGDPLDEGDIVYTGESPETYCFWRAMRDVPAATDPRDPENQLQYYEPYYNSNYTLSFNEKVNQWSSFYSYKSTLFASYMNTFLTPCLVPGETDAEDAYWMFEHNRGTEQTWYGVAFNAYVQMVFNNAAEIYKTARSYFIRCEEQPSYMHCRGFIDGNVPTATFAEASDFEQKREFFWVNVKNDATISVSNPSGINTGHTAQISGETIQMRLYFNGPNKINEVSQTYFMKPRFFNM